MFLIKAFIRRSRSWYSVLPVLLCSALTENRSREPYDLLLVQTMVIDREPVQFARWIKEGRPTRYVSGVTRAAIDSVTPTTAFLTRHLPFVSRTRRTEYQLLLMKASDRDRNVIFGKLIWLCFDELLLLKHNIS